MQSIAFQGCAGWFYDARSTRGVVICAPLGLEELCGRRTLHLLAQRLAAAGLPTLRFDYRGECDSTGDALDPDCLERWRQDARAAIAEPVHAVLLVALVVSLFWHGALGLQVIIEDYVHSRWQEITLQILVRFGAFLAAVACLFAIARIALH